MEQSWCFRGEEEMRSATSFRPGMRLSLAKHLSWGPQRALLEWGEQRPWSPADLIGVPRELRSNGERRSDGALYFGMPKSFSEVRDDEGYRLCDPSAECECKITAFF